MQKNEKSIYGSEIDLDEIKPELDEAWFEEADLYDGSDVVTLVWLGRRHIAGIEPGRALSVRGRIAVREGRKVIYNPYYELELPR